MYPSMGLSFYVGSSPTHMHLASPVYPAEASDRVQVSSTLVVLCTVLCAMEGFACMNTSTNLQLSCEQVSIALKHQVCVKSRGAHKHLDSKRIIAGLFHSRASRCLPSVLQHRQAHTLPSAFTESRRSNKKVRWSCLVD